MRIGFDLAWFPPHKTGVAFYVERLIRGIHKRYGDSMEIHLFVNKYSHREFDGLGDVTLHHVRGPNSLKYFYFQFYFSRILNRVPLDIIHFPFYTYYGRINAKKIFTVLDLYYMYDKDCLPNRRVYYYWAKIFVKNLKNADIVAAISQNTKEDILKFVPAINRNKIRVLYPILDERYKPLYDVSQRNELMERYHLNRPYLLSIGESGVKRRNIMQLIHGYKKAIEAGYTFDLVLVGISDKTRIADLTIDFGIAARVHILGYTHEDDLILLHQCARYCVVPSLYEGFSYPVVQSIKCGVPVIVSRNSCLSEVAGRSAIYIESPFSALKIADALLRSDDEELYIELAEQCMHHNEQFDDNILISEYFKMYKEAAH